MQDIYTSHLVRAAILPIFGLALSGSVCVWLFLSGRRAWCPNHLWWSKDQQSGWQVQVKIGRATLRNSWTSLACHSSISVCTHHTECVNSLSLGYHPGKFTIHLMISSRLWRQKLQRIVPRSWRRGGQSQHRGICGPLHSIMALVSSFFTLQVLTFSFFCLTF